MILSTIKSRTANFCGDPNQSRYSALYTDAINDAQKQFSLDTGALFKDQAYTTVSGTSTYALPSDFIVEDDVTYDGLPLKAVSRHNLYLLYPHTDWTILSGAPTSYMVDPEEASKVLRLIPIPDDAKTVSMRYLPLPADVSADSDVVLNASTLLVQYHLGIAAFAAYLILASEDMTPMISEKRNELLKAYHFAVNAAVEKFGNTKSAPWRLRGSRPVA